MYLGVEYTTVAFDSIFGNVIQLDEDHSLGDIIRINDKDFILTDTGNPEIIFDCHNNDSFKAGQYVQIIPLEYIQRMVSDGVFDIPGFQCCGDTTRFYKIKSFDKNMNEVTDMNDFHDVTRYYYVRN